jgi:hypothetical protein
MIMSIFNAFQIIQCFFGNNKNTCYNVLNMYNLNILHSLDSFQKFPHVPIIYYKYFHLNTLKTCNINIVLTLKHEKPNNDYNYYSHTFKMKTNVTRDWFCILYIGSKIVLMLQVFNKFNMIMFLIANAFMYAITITS